MSADGGKTLKGTMTYRGEGPIHMEAGLSSATAYTVENQWGGPDSDWNPGGVFVLGNRKRSQPVSIQTGFPKGDFYLTTKSADKQKFALESSPVTLKKIGNNTGMFWKATPTKVGYFTLTSQYLEEKDQVLEGSDGESAAVMVPNTGATGTEWKATPAGNGYYYLTSRFMEEKGKVLYGNVGDTDAAGGSPFDGAPYMVDRKDAGPSAQWKFIEH